MRVAIIGAGFTGLAAAWDVHRAGHAVTVYEAGPRPGGLAGGFREPGWDWSLEYFYHHWFASDRHILGWLREMGLHEGVCFFRPLTVVYHAGRFYPFDSPVNVLRFPGLNAVDKIRLGLVTLYLRLTRNWKPLEAHTAHEWLSKALGKRAYTALWEPLLEGKFGPYAREVNMAWFWARIHARTPRLGTYVGGFQALADRIMATLQARGVVFRLNTPVERLLPREEGGAWVVTPQAREPYDRVLITVGPPQLPKLLPELAENPAFRPERWPSLGALALILALRRPFRTEGFYWYNVPKRAGFPFLILVEHTHFVPARHFGGDHILYVGDYLPADHPYMRMEPEVLLETYLPGLRRVQPHFRREDVRAMWCFRARYAQPVPLRYHSRNLPPTRLPYPGMYWASMGHVYPWDRGTNYAVALGRQVARQMLEKSGI